jgi:hypothetical protein
MTLNGVGQLPEDDNQGHEPNVGEAHHLLSVITNGQELSQSAILYEDSMQFQGSFELVNNGDSGYFIGYIGASANLQGAISYTVDSIMITDFALSLFETDIRDAFTNTPIALNGNIATNVVLTIGEHEGHTCVAFTLDERSIVYLYFEDAPNNEENIEQLPAETIFTITIGSEILNFEDFIWMDGGYMGMFEQNSSDLAVDGVITATITTNLEGKFELVDGTTFSLTPNTAQVIDIQGMEGMYAIAYDNQTYFFAFVFADTDM